MCRHRRGESGYSLIEMAIAVALLGVLLVGLGTAFSQQAEVMGQAGDAYNVLIPAASALNRICDEIGSTTQDPEGVTAAPVYAVGATSITIRSAVGYLSIDHSDYDECKTAGLLSNNGVLYASYAKQISYDATAHTVKIEYVNTPGPPTGISSATTALLVAGLPPSSARVEILARDVVAFAFFSGESKAATPAAPTTASWVLGARIEVQRPSAAPGAKGASVSSSMGGATLVAKARVAPEVLVKSKSRPVVE